MTGAKANAAARMAAFAGRDEIMNVSLKAGWDRRMTIAGEVSAERGSSVRAVGLPREVSSAATIAWFVTGCRS
jgi:hypothetical protein